MDYIEYTERNEDNDENTSLTKSYEDSLLEKSDDLKELDDSTLNKINKQILWVKILIKV